MIIDGKEWKLVPVEATAEMCADGGTHCGCGGMLGDPETARLVYRQMLSAAPAPPEVVVSDEMAKKVAHYYHHHPVRNSNAADGRDMIDAVQSILGPALGMVELKEPTPEECDRILDFWVCGSGEEVGAGRAMFAAVSKWLKGEL